MPNYLNAKIFSIRSYLTDKIFIGCTTKKLSKRFSDLKSDFKKGRFNSTSKEIIKLGDAYIELIEDFPCDKLEQLNKRTGEIIRNTVNCVNKQIKGRTTHQYNIDNKEIILKNKKEYRENNQDKIQQYSKEYRDNNQYKIKEYNKINSYKNKKYQLAYREKKYGLSTVESILIITYNNL